jgi:hypothetical protein
MTTAGIIVSALIGLAVAWVWGVMIVKVIKKEKLKGLRPGYHNQGVSIPTWPDEPPPKSGTDPQAKTSSSDDAKNA